jgi:transposase
MHDNAPCHAAQSVKAFLAENDVKSLNWPASSPDLNPIGNLWAWIKKKHESDFPFPSTKQQLIANIMQIWDQVSFDMVQNLCSSFPRRLEECIRRNGKPTKY